MSHPSILEISDISDRIRKVYKPSIKMTIRQHRRSFKASRKHVPLADKDWTGDTDAQVRGLLKGMICRYSAGGAASWLAINNEINGR